MTAVNDFSEVPPLNVKLVDSIPLPLLQVEKERKKEIRVTHKTIVLTAANPSAMAAQIDPLRIEAHIETMLNQVVMTTGIGAANDVSNTIASTPAFTVTNQNGGNVPATGVAWQNPYSVPVQVVIAANGATITNVSVNGVTVGTAAGTYFVPAYGAISVAYSVATPTWIWTGIGIPVVSNLVNPNGRVLNPGVGEYVVPGGANELWFTAGTFPTMVGVTLVREV